MPKVRDVQATKVVDPEPEDNREVTVEPNRDVATEGDRDSAIGGSSDSDEPKPEKKPVRSRSRAKPKAKPQTNEVVDTMTQINAEDSELTNLEQEPDYVAAILYGREGTHKTTNVLRLTMLEPKGQLLVINAEGGLKKRPLQEHGVDLSRVSVWPRPGQRITFEGMERLFFRIADDLDKNPDSWLGVVWDSVTEIYKTLIDIQVDNALSKQTELSAKGVTLRNSRERFDVVRDDYSVMTQQIRQLLRKYRYLPCHFFITALERRAEDEDTKRVMYGPNVNPALQDDLMAHVDIVLRTQVDEEIGLYPVGLGDSVPTRRQRAKERYGVLPALMVDPSADRIVRYVRGELKPETDPIQELLDRQKDTDSDDVPEPVQVQGEKPTNPAKKRPSRKRVSATPTDNNPPF